MKNNNLGTIYLNKRAEYNKYNGVYALGTFLNTDATNLTGHATQLVPTDRTIANFDTLSDAGYTKDSFEETADLYQVDSNEVKELISEMRNGESMQVVAEVAEFLEGVGKQQPEHTVHVTEVLAADKTTYYFLQAGASALEASNNALRESDSQYDYTLFTGNGANVNIIEDSMALFVLEYLNHTLDKHLSPADILETSEIGQAFDKETNSNLILLIIHVR